MTPSDLYFAKFPRDMFRDSIRTATIEAGPGNFFPAIVTDAVRSVVSDMFTLPPVGTGNSPAR